MEFTSLWLKESVPSFSDNEGPSFQTTLNLRVDPVQSFGTEGISDQKVCWCSHMTIRYMTGPKGHKIKRDRDSSNDESLVS